MTIIKNILQVASYYKTRFNLDSSAFGTSMAFVLMAIVVLSPESSWAAGTQHADTMSAIICNIVSELQGPVARGIAAAGIIFLGFSLFLGKISWGVAIALGIGVAAVFGANELVDIMVGDGTDTCADNA